MDYRKIYDDLMTKARSENRKKGEGVYYEAHHILPKCMGGEGKVSQWKYHPNIILLTGAEHYVAHQLLCEIYPNEKSLIHALWGMTNQKGSKTKRTYKPSSKQYERFRIAHAVSSKNTQLKKQTEFINQVKILLPHYDYSESIYNGSKKTVKVICVEHGEFFKKPTHLLRGQGCVKCSNEELAKKNRKSLDDFINEAYKVHGNIYDYSKVVYVNAQTKVEIICKEHGTFYQTPNNHLQGFRCKECAKVSFNVSKGVKIKNTLTGEVFNSIKDVAIKYPEYSSNLSAKLNPNNKRNNNTPFVRV